MKDGRTALKQACGAKMAAAILADGTYTGSRRVLVEPVPGETLPYVVIDGTTVIPFSTKNVEGGNYTQACRAIGGTRAEAEALAAICVETLTDRSAPLDPGSDFVLSLATLDFGGEAEASNVNEEDYYTVPFRVRFMLQEA